MKTRAILAFLLAQLAFSGMAQKLPDWIINKPTPTNSTYLYVVESATGKNEMEARNRAIGEVFRSTAMRIGQPFDSEEINRALQRGTEYYVISSQYNIPINKVCEYTDTKTSPCRVYVLCQVAKAGNIHVEFDDFNASIGFRRQNCIAMQVFMNFGCLYMNLEVLEVKCVYVMKSDWRQHPCDVVLNG